MIYCDPYIIWIVWSHPHVSKKTPAQPVGAFGVFQAKTRILQKVVVSAQLWQSTS